VGLLISVLEDYKPEGLEKLIYAFTLKFYFTQ
jgi:hypothetical protein